FNIRRGQKASAGVNRRGGIGKVEGRVGTDQAQIAFEEGPDGADVFPIAVEQVHLYVFAADDGGKDLFAKVVIGGFLQSSDQHVAIEDVNTHASQQVASATGNAAAVDPRR